MDGIKVTVLPKSWNHSAKEVLRLRYKITPIADNPWQMGIRTWSAQHLQLGPNVCLWEDEESNGCLISKCFQMAQYFFDTHSSQSGRGDKKELLLWLPKKWGGGSAYGWVRQAFPPGAATASLWIFNRKGSCFSSNFPPQFHNSNVVHCEWIQHLL